MSATCFLYFSVIWFHMMEHLSISWHKISEEMSNFILSSSYNSYNLEYYVWQGQNGKEEYFFCFLLLSHVALFRAILQCSPFAFLRFTNTRPVYAHRISLCIIQILRDVYRKHVRIPLSSFEIRSSSFFSKIQFPSFATMCWFIVTSFLGISLLSFINARNHISQF